jgi:Fe-S-cluster-containing hydrogenase component 2
MLLGEDSIVWINENECIGCGKCVKACSFTPSRINLVKSKDKAKRKAKKCDLCRTQTEGPACVRWCPVRCIGISDQPYPQFDQTTAPSASEPSPDFFPCGGAELRDVAD